MIQPPLSRNAQILKYFVQQYSGVPRKRLVKLVYMADVLAREYLGHAISTFQYRLDKYGPYDPAIVDAVGELESRGLAREWKEQAEVPWIRLSDLHQAVTFDFSLGESEVLDHVTEFYIPMEMTELLEEVVYETKPMKLANHLREPLDMEVLNDQGKKRVGFDLERVIQAEKQAEAGDFLTLEAFVDGLRNRIAARH